VVVLYGFLVSYFKLLVQQLIPSLKRNNTTELFEDNQRDLERAVENLSFLLEQPIENQSLAKLRQDITNESVSPNSSAPLATDDLGIRPEAT
jgi:hypothetical protein